LRIVAALGGNALGRRAGTAEDPVDRGTLAHAARALAPLAAAGELIVTHGNGPQVGFLALQAGHPGTHAASSLDVLDAETEGWIGYLLEQALDEALPDREVATLLTRVEVDRNDPAFDHPDKPIGPIYHRSECARLSAERGFQFVETGRGWRRVVPSPSPGRIVELAAIRLLVEAGVVVVCAGGGGIPVSRDPDGRQRGVEAVIDKDACSALLAAQLDAQVLLLLTDVPGVFRDWPRPAARPIAEVAVAELAALRLEPGSMAPKVAAACGFVRRTGGFAAIGALADAERLANGEAGTRVRG